MSNAPQDPNADYPQQSSSGARTVIIVLIVVVVLVIGLCACGAGGLYFVYDKGTEQMAEDVKGQLEGNPVLEEELGAEFSIQFDFGATLNESQENPEAAGSLVFNVEGTEGKGVLIVKAAPGGSEISSVQLEMEDGRVIDVPTGGDALQEGDVDLGDPQPAGDVTNEEAEPATNEDAGDGGAEADAPAGAGAGN